MKAFDPSSWVDGVTTAHALDFQHIATDIATCGQNIDGGGYGRSNTGYITMVPGALPGTTYTVTAASWSAGVVTLTIGSNVIQINQLVSIAGVTPSGYNTPTDFVKVTAIPANQIQFALAVNPGTWVSGGTVNVGTPPAFGTYAIDQNLHLQVYTGSSWAAATTAVAAGIWWSGSGVPSSGLGSNGDMYLRTSNGDVYGPKTAGSWGSVVSNLIGPTGGPGPTGPTGPTGPGYLATSTTSITVATGSTTWTTQSGLAYLAGDRALVTSTGSGAYMEGLVTAYSGTSLTVNVTVTSGSGAHTDWNIGLTGTVGPQGPQGIGYNPRGAYNAGTTYAQGDMVSSGSVIYISLQNANIGNTPASSPTFWQPYAGLLDPGSNGVIKRTALNTTAVAVGADLPLMVASGGSHSAGAAPDPGSSAGTTHFLREDATWAVPAGGVTGQASGNPWFCTPTGSRAVGAVYHNTGTTPVTVLATLSIAASSQMNIHTDASSTPSANVGAYVNPAGGPVVDFPITFIVLPGNYYSIVQTLGTVTLIILTEWQ